MTQQELGHWLRLVSADGIGPKTAAKLLAAFGLPEHIFEQQPERLARVIPAEQAQAMLAPTAEHEALLEQTWAWLQSAPPGQFREVLSLADAAYPRLLLSLPDPPPLIFVMGARAAFDRLSAQETARDIAMVGSRNATPQGLANARAFAHALAQSGLNIVSGLALGIDGAAHEGALQAQREMGAGAGVPIAVVGTGLDRVYPKRHLALAHDIASCGLILSEFLIGTAPRPENFPRRNRIIAALTQATLVVEAAIESGSLITARQALDLGKDVFAIPGSIHSPQSKGCHHLIKQGAKLVESASDVLDELVVPASSDSASAMLSEALRPDSARAEAANEAQNEADSALLQALGHDPVDIDSLIDRTGIPAAQLQVLLLELELSGTIARLPGGLFQRQQSA